jgi:hypothetical protein
MWRNFFEYLKPGVLKVAHGYDNNFCSTTFENMSIGLKDWKFLTRQPKFEIDLLTYLCGTTTNIWLRPFEEDLSMTAFLEHNASNLWPLDQDWADQGFVNGEFCLAWKVARLLWLAHSEEALICSLDSSLYFQTQFIRWCHQGS